MHAKRPSLSRKKSRRLRTTASARVPLDNFTSSSHFVRLAFPSGREQYMNFAKKCALSVVSIAAITFAPAARAQDAKPAETPKAAEAPKPATIEVTPNGTEVHVGDKVQFKAVAKDASGKVMDVKPTVWFAAPFDVAGADDKGVVVFHAPGIVTVGVVINEKPGIAHVTVVTPPVAKIDIAPVSMALAVGGSTVLSATARSSNGDPRTDTPIQWKSTTPAIAKIDASGLVTAVAPGTAKFQATAGPASAETSLHVVADPVQSITVSPADTNAKTGDVVHFTAAAKGAKGAVKDVITSWSVSGAGASIYPDGGFVAVRPGTYVVRASIGRHDAVCVHHRRAAQCRTQYRSGGAHSVEESHRRHRPADLRTMDRRQTSLRFNDRRSRLRLRYFRSRESQGARFDEGGRAPRQRREHHARRKSRRVHARRRLESQERHRVLRRFRSRASESAIGIHRNRYRRRPQRVHQFALRLHHRRRHRFAPHHRFPGCCSSERSGALANRKRHRANDRRPDGANGNRAATSTICT